MSLNHESSQKSSILILFWFCSELKRFCKASTSEYLALLISSRMQKRSGTNLQSFGPGLALRYFADPLVQSIPAQIWPQMCLPLTVLSAVGLLGLVLG